MTTQILAVQRMQDCVEAHLDEPIGMDALARAAAFSPRQACRLFLAHTGARRRAAFEGCGWRGRRCG